MHLVTIDDVPGGSAGAHLGSGEILHFARAARAGSIEAWVPGSLVALLSGGTEGLAVAERLVARADADPNAVRAQGAVLPAGTRLLAPIPAPRLILAAGLAYHSHLAEMSGTPVPRDPTGFLKAPSSVAASGEPLRLPPHAGEMVDYEGELAVVFGRECHHVGRNEAMDYVAGYTVANDISARDWVRSVWAAETPWEARQTWEVNIMGKQLPGFTALGPVIATKASVPDPTRLRLVTRLNGEVVQDAPISDMIFPIEQTIAHFSRWYRFQPGDVLLTGTPAGVGVGRKPPLFLGGGDLVEVEISEIGTLSTPVVAPDGTTRPHR